MSGNGICWLKGQTGVKRVKEWARQTGQLQDWDILVSGSADEVMLGSSLHRLRWCELTTNLTTASLWMPQVRLIVLIWVLFVLV